MAQFESAILRSLAFSAGCGWLRGYAELVPAQDEV